MAYQRLQNDRFVDDATGIVHENRPGVGMVAVGDESGAAHVSDVVANPPGIARTRFISASTGVLPVARSSVVTITIATPGVVTWTAHGFADGTPIVLSTTGALPTGLTAGTVYYIVAGAANTFQLSATSGGAAINTSGTQSGVHTAKARNGVAEFSNGVKGLVINEVTVVSGTLPTAANTNFAVRYAPDCASDAVAAILLPITVNTSSSLAEAGQIGGFNLVPVWNGTSFSLILEQPVFINVTSAVDNLYIIHNIGALLVLQFHVSAVEAV